MSLPGNFDAWLTTDPNEALGYEERQHTCESCGESEMIEFEVFRTVLVAECPNCEEPIEIDRDDL